MNTKQIRTTENVQLGKKTTRPKTQLINDVKQEEKVKHAIK
jgi:hypothetical protein